MPKDNIAKRLDDLENRVAQLEDLLGATGQSLYEVGRDLLGLDEDMDLFPEDEQSKEAEE